MSTFIITRIHVGDYERWRPMFDQARARLVASGVLDRFEDRHGPNVVVEA